MSKNIKIPIVAELSAEGKTPDILFWVGCAGSLDARAQKISRAFARILNHAGISFAILGQEESCTGDPARRAGNEFLFQMLALQNIQTLNGYGIRRIVTACPHCYNILKNEYPRFGGEYEVYHHTQYLDKLMSDGKLNLRQMPGDGITYHDSCYLGRVNGEYEAPRNLLNALRSDVREMERSGTNGLCCGAGGAQMYKEEEPGDKRVSTERAEEAISTGSRTIAANCPFCITMLTDGIKAKDKQDEVMVYDLSELIVQQLKD